MLLGKILAIVTSRRVKQEMAKQGIAPVNMVGVMFKVVLIAMFFGVDISYVVKELNNRIELRRFAKVGEIPEARKIYRFMSRFSEKQFVGFISGTLSSICVKRGRNRVILVDSIDILLDLLDLNWLRKKLKRLIWRKGSLNGGILHPRAIT